MRLLHRASSWRSLFLEDELPDSSMFPAVLAPLRDAFSRIDRTPNLSDAKAWQPVLCRALLRLDLPGWRISQILSDHDDWLYRHSIRQALASMQASGWGPPPVPFCVLTMGSVARHESLLAPDQDNGMIIANYPDAQHDVIDGFFQALGERFTDALDEAGIPICNGHVMARWPMWRKRLSEWQEQLRIWTAGRIVKRVQQANILLDFSAVYGDVSLAETLRNEAVSCVPGNRLFLDEMADLLSETPPALDRFGRLTPDDREAPHDAALNLKRQGILPLQNAVRLLAVGYAVRSVDSRGRLQSLVAQGVLEAAFAQMLIQTFNHFQALLLDAQLASFRSGRHADGWIDLRRIDGVDRLLLRHGLDQVQRLVSLARQTGKGSI